MPALRPRAKRTLNVLYRLTTEMGNVEVGRIVIIIKSQYSHAELKRFIV